MVSNLFIDSYLDKYGEDEHLLLYIMMNLALCGKELISR